MAGTRLQIVSCFTIFALLLAPIAWHLTQVERVELPVAAIQALSLNESQYELKHRQIYVVTTSDVETTAVSPGVFDADVHVTRIALSKKERPDTAASLHVVDDWLEQVLPRRTATEFAVVLLCDPAKNKEEDIVVGKYRHAFSSACSLGSPLLQSAVKRLVKQHVFPDENERVERKQAMRQARVAARYRLQFTLLGAQPGTQQHGSWKWDFSVWYQQYLQSFVQKMHNIADFSVEQQTVHYARIANAIHDDPSHGYSYVDAEDLKHFKSMNDFLAATVVEEREQVLHLMAVVPDIEHSPLIIKPSADSRPATAFEIPSWGLVAILNPQKLVDPTAESAEMQRLAGIFLAELRVLLGLPSFVSRQRQENTVKESARLQFLASPRDAVAQWELDVVTRKLVHRHIHNAIETLQSTIELVTDMTQMSVLPRVEKRILKALKLVQSTANGGDEGVEGELEALLVRARHAADEADAAYYDHTMVRQLYFPQEQLLGVYAPLLGPLLLPFIAGWIREWKRWKSKQHKQQEPTSKTEEQVDSAERIKSST